MSIISSLLSVYIEGIWFGQDKKIKHIQIYEAFVVVIVVIPKHTLCHLFTYINITKKTKIGAGINHSVSSISTIFTTRIFNFCDSLNASVITAVFDICYLFRYTFTCLSMLFHFLVTFQQTWILAPDIGQCPAKNRFLADKSSFTTDKIENTTEV